MTDKHFKALAAAIRVNTIHSDIGKGPAEERRISLRVIIKFCESQNPTFNRERFLKACTPEWTW